MSFTSIPNNPGDYTFKRYSLFAVFYKGHIGARWHRSVRSGIGGRKIQRPRSRWTVTTPRSVRHLHLSLRHFGAFTSSSRSISGRC